MTTPLWKTGYKYIAVLLESNHEGAEPAYEETQMRETTWKYVSDLRLVFHLSELRAPYDGIEYV